MGYCDMITPLCIIFNYCFECLKYRYVRELTFLHLFLVPKSILVFWKIEQLSNKTKILKTLLCHQYLTDFIDLKM